MQHASREARACGRERGGKDRRSPPGGCAPSSSLPRNTWPAALPLAGCVPLMLPTPLPTFCATLCPVCSAAAEAKPADAQGCSRAAGGRPAAAAAAAAAPGMLLPGRSEVAAAAAAAVLNPAAPPASGSPAVQHGMDGVGVGQ